LSRIKASAKHRKIFASVRDPAASAGTAADDNEAVVLIRALDVLPLEFQLVPSPTEQEAIAACRGIVANGKTEDAEAFWRALVLRAENARLGGGTIALGDLWAEVRRPFRNMSGARFKQVRQCTRADLPALRPREQPRGEAGCVESQARIVDEGRRDGFPTAGAFVDAEYGVLSRSSIRHT
jgi:hypothetical protein